MITSLRNIEETSDDERDPEQSLIKGPAHEVRLLVEKQFSRLEHMENAFAEAVERIGKPLPAQALLQIIMQSLHRAVLLPLQSSRIANRLSNLDLLTQML